MGKRSKSVVKYGSPEANRLNTTTLELDVLALRAKNCELSKSLADSKQEIARLQRIVDCLQRERFESDTLNNNYRNVISNMDSLLKSSLTQIVGLSDNFAYLCNIAASAGPSLREGSQSPSTSKQPPQPQQVASPCSGGVSRDKAHLIKPHMVNGHILHIPTIKLIRCNELQHGQHDNSGHQDGQNAENNHNNSDPQDRTFDRLTANYSVRHTRSEIERMDVSEVSIADEPLPPSEFEGGDSETSRLDTIEEDEESPQMRSRNSSLLSGVFQDVRIYLTQTPPEKISKFYERKSRQQQQQQHEDNRLPPASSSPSTQQPQPYMCRPSLSERDQHQLPNDMDSHIEGGDRRSSLSSFVTPSTSNNSLRDFHNESGSNGAGGDDDNNLGSLGTEIFRASLQKRSFCFKKSSGNDSSYYSQNSRSSLASCSASSSSSMSQHSFEEENEELNNSKLVVMKELGLAPSHLTKTTPPGMRKLRSKYSEYSVTTTTTMANTPNEQPTTPELPPTHITKRKNTNPPVTVTPSRSRGRPIRFSTGSPIKTINRRSARMLEDRVIRQINTRSSKPALRNSLNSLSPRRPSFNVGTPQRMVNYKRGSQASEGKKSDPKSQGDNRISTVGHSADEGSGNSSVASKDKTKNRFQKGRSEVSETQSEEVVVHISSRERTSDSVSQIIKTKKISSEKTNSTKQDSRITVHKIVSSVAKELGIKRKDLSPKKESPKKMLKRNNGTRSPMKNPKSTAVKHVDDQNSPKRRSSSESVTEKSGSIVAKKVISSKIIRRSYGSSSPKKVIARKIVKKGSGSPSNPKKFTSTRLVARKSPALRKSPRPSRAAKPQSLKEVPLNKKMRR